MSKSFIDLSNDFENLNEEYHTSIHIVGDEGDIISFEASGETPEELFNNILLNGIETIMDSKISEEDNDLDNDAPCTCSCHSEDDDDDIDTDELLLQYIIDLEEENEMLRDEVHYVRNLLKQTQDSLAKQEDLVEESFKYIDELEEENENLYKVISALQTERISKKVTKKYMTPYHYKVWM